MASALLFLINDHPSFRAIFVVTKNNSSIQTFPSTTESCIFDYLLIQNVFLENLFSRAKWLIWPALISGFHSVKRKRVCAESDKIGILTCSSVGIGFMQKL